VVTEAELEGGAGADQRSLLFGFGGVEGVVLGYVRDQQPQHVSLLARARGKFIVSDALVKEKGHQALVQILYQILDKTRISIL
jgi:hypothetical protein